MKAWLGLAFLTIVMGILLFGCAGIFRYWQAWVYLVIFLVSTGLITLHLMKNNPALLERRVKAGPIAEQETTQKIIQALASLAFLAIFVVSALDRRLAWSAIPFLVVVAGDFLVVVGLYIVFVVFKENAFTSATIEVNKGQELIATGLYSKV